MSNTVAVAEWFTAYADPVVVSKRQNNRPRYHRANPSAEEPEPACIVDGGTWRVKERGYVERTRRTPCQNPRCFGKDGETADV